MASTSEWVGPNAMGGREVEEVSLQSLSSHRLFHTVPNVPHYSSKCVHPSPPSPSFPLLLSLPHPENKAIGVMKPGHSFTIEPMINEGMWEAVKPECSFIIFPSSCRDVERCDLARPVDSSHSGECTH